MAEEPFLRERVRFAAAELIVARSVRRGGLVVPDGEADALNRFR
jgi:hypothetical protein